MDDRRQKRREKILNAGKDRLQKITGTLYKDGPAPDDETTAPNTVEVSAKETKKPAVTSESTSRNTSKPTSPVELQPESPKRFLPGAQQDDGVADDENEAAKPAVLKKPRLILGVFSIETIMMVLAAFIAFVWMYLSLTLDIAIPDEAMENQRIELKEKYGDLADFFIYIEGLQMAGRMVLSDGRVAGVVADVMASFVRGNPAEEVGIFTAVPIFGAFILAESTIITRRNDSPLDMISGLWQDFTLFFFSLAVFLHSFPSLISMVATNWML